MISYVDCLSAEPVGVSRKCWKGAYSEDEDELLPRKMVALQPKTEGSLRRRLLTSKIHQQQDVLWAPRPLAEGPQHDKPSQGLFTHPYTGPQPKGSPPGLLLHHRQKLSLNLGSKPQPGYFSMNQHRRTSYSPTTPEPQHGYSFCPPPPGAPDYLYQGSYPKQAPSHPMQDSHNPNQGPYNPLQGPYNPNQGPYNPLQGPYNPNQASYNPIQAPYNPNPRLPGRHKASHCSLRLQKTQCCFPLQWRRSTQSPLATTPLLQRDSDGDWRAVSVDEDSKWSVHYTTQKPQQERVFLSETRPSCVNDLPSRVNLHNVLLECDRLSKTGYGSMQYFPQSPAPSCASLPESSLHDPHRKDRGPKKSNRLLDCLSQSCFSVFCQFRPWRRKSSVSLAEDEGFVYATSPPVLHGAVSCDDIMTNGYEAPETEEEWIKPLPLPTPEEKMRLQAQAIPAD
ncbi:uncharacterized protein LOC134007853 [Osmerus eperlanus]|uniref:uncharacterized protein LOC134007853 n=1 Tax=Osmerus eperlanus TaxID=29151 RepID=UPI002E14F3D9